MTFFETSVFKLCIYGFQNDFMKDLWLLCAGGKREFHVHSASTRLFFVGLETLQALGRVKLNDAGEK